MPAGGPVSTHQKPHRGCPRSLALGDRGDSGPQLTGRSPRSSKISPGKRRSRPQPPTGPKNLSAVLQIITPFRRTMKENSRLAGLWCWPFPRAGQHSNPDAIRAANEGKMANLLAERSEKRMRNRSFFRAFHALRPTPSPSTPYSLFHTPLPPTPGVQVGSRPSWSLGPSVPWSLVPLVPAFKKRTVKLCGL